MDEFDAADAAAQLDSCQYLYLRDLGEPRDNSLRLVIQEADASGEVDASHPIVKLFGNAFGDYRKGELRSIVSDASSRSFELYWDRYVAYAIHNEGFQGADETAESTGRLLRTHSRSRFLDYILESTFAAAVLDLPLVHFGIYCQNHNIDVVSTERPSIKIIAPQLPFNRN